MAYIYGLLFWNYTTNTFINPRRINEWLENIKYESITFALPIADKILKKYKKIYTFISFDVIIKQMF